MILRLISLCSSLVLFLFEFEETRKKKEGKKAKDKSKRDLESGMTSTPFLRILLRATL